MPRGKSSEWREGRTQRRSLTEIANTRGNEEAERRGTERGEPNAEEEDEEFLEWLLKSHHEVWNQWKGNGWDRSQWKDVAGDLRDEIGDDMVISTDILMNEQNTFFDK